MRLRIGTMLCLCFASFSQSARADEQREFVILGTRHDGMFSMFYDVILAMKIYEAGLYAGIEIDFGYPHDNSMYYDERYGSNWWTYYFEPIRYGDTSAPEHRVVGYLPYGVPWNLDTPTMGTRENAHRLIQKYIRIKPHIMEKVDQFVQANFNGEFIIAVHYRGTDKWNKCPAYEKVFAEIHQQIQISGRPDYKIFIATDSQEFLDHALSRYDKVCYREETYRSPDWGPIHLNPWTDKYRAGEEALIDCLLLSKGDVLIRTDSNLSYCATFFNPNIPEIFVNR